MTDPTRTRGARKLQAALEAFALADAVRGARAIDIGASTGGFTATLLEHGAREVTAIDVGEGQLAPQLRADARVRSFEKTDFRRAPLALAEGPFDFFSVDVSFMAARNVLRPLAFRLRAQARGVVLLKPQFELPKSRVQDGEVRDPNARAEALAKFSERARELGFEVVESRDSPVSGGSGSIEMLLHVRFLGRTAKLPAPGERREPKAPAQRKPAKPIDTAGALRWFAVAAPGLDGALHAELAALWPDAMPTQTEGGVELRGPLELGYALNLRSRIATRVWLRMGEVDAREFAALRHRLARLPLERVLSPERPVRVDVATHRCRLYHTKALAETLLLAANDRLGASLQPHRSASELEAPLRSAGAVDMDEAPELASGLPLGQEPFTRVLLRGDGDRFTLSVDSSGALLHRRGARIETGRAPLRETLAAGMLKLAGYDGSEPLINAMCGAGTIALEGLGIALHHAPGRLRHFAIETFAGVDGSAFARAREQARAQERDTPSAPVLAFDRDPHAVERARRNAERAGVLPHLRLQACELAAAVPETEGGLVIANPPYGHRLGSARSARAGHEAMVRALRERFRGFRLALLLPRDAPLRGLRLRDEQRFALNNGGIAVSLIVGRL